MRDPTTATARAAKRKEGVFYTPSDVADFMVGHIFNALPAISAEAKWLNPATGTGVFLLSVCRAAARRCTQPQEFPSLSYVTNCLFGCDISPHALDATAFVLLRECLPDTRRKGAHALGGMACHPAEPGRNQLNDDRSSKQPSEFRRQMNTHA